MDPGGLSEKFVPAASYLTNSLNNCFQIKEDMCLMNDYLRVSLKVGVQLWPR